jgi:hypothetical protein
MKKEELIKGKWYFTTGNVYIKFDYFKVNDLWVTEYITSSGSYYKDSGYTCETVVREATADDYLKYPVMGVFNTEITNYEIF